MVGCFFSLFLTKSKAFLSRGAQLDAFLQRAMFVQQSIWPSPHNALWFIIKFLPKFFPASNFECSRLLSRTDKPNINRAYQQYECWQTAHWWNPSQNPTNHMRMLRCSSARHFPGENNLKYTNQNGAMVMKKIMCERDIQKKMLS